MHVRRALLLFAIVLGLAALATSVSRPARESSREERSEPPVAPQAAPQAEPENGELELPGPRGRRSVTLRAGQAATLLVSVPEAGEVELPTLGLTASADPLTPARFELLAADPGSHVVRFEPSEGGEPHDYGRVMVR